METLSKFFLRVEIIFFYDFNKVFSDRGKKHAFVNEVLISATPLNLNLTLHRKFILQNFLPSLSEEIY